MRQGSSLEKLAQGPLPSMQRLTPAWETTGNALTVLQGAFLTLPFPPSHSGTGSQRRSLRTRAPDFSLYVKGATGSSQGSSHWLASDTLLWVSSVI